MDKKQAPLNHERQTQQYNDFMKWWSDPMAVVFKDHLQAVKERYSKDVKRWLRGEGSNEAVGQKARLATQAQDIIENVMTVHIDEIAKKLTPLKEEDGSEIY